MESGNQGVEKTGGITDVNNCVILNINFNNIIKRQFISTTFNHWLQFLKSSSATILFEPATYSIHEMSRNSMGILAMEIYFPKTYVDQAELETFDGVSRGKYTQGLGQLQLSFTFPFEDVNSMALTGYTKFNLVVGNLLRKKKIHPRQVGRLEVGSQTLVDKSKSTKTVLMDLFGEDTDIEGATSLNACYGAMNALINGINWLSSDFWDGRYCIVVASDIACYEKGPARCTGGAGAIAILLGPNAGITFERERASFCQNRYDFYKPNPHSQYPTVDGKLSIQSYLMAVEQCYELLSKKLRIDNLESETDFFCFHSPFYKMVMKAFTRITEIQYQKRNTNQIQQQFNKKVHPCHYLSRQIGNIYTGSVFASLMSLLMANPEVENKKVCLFSYGSGLCSTMMVLHVKKNILEREEIENILSRLERRVKIEPEKFDQIMQKREKQYGKFRGKIPIQETLAEHLTYHLSEIDAKFRRKYQLYTRPMELGKKTISSSAVSRIENLTRAIVRSPQSRKFYDLSIQQRRKVIQDKSATHISHKLLDNGGLTLQIANQMTENVVGIASLPLSFIPLFVINNREIIIPMAIQEASVVAACSSIGKFMAPYSFHSTSTPDIMIGQVHLPNSEANQIHTILTKKKQYVQKLNAKCCMSMVERGGGVVDIKIRQLNGINSKQYSVDVFVNVCDAMGANLVNTIAEQLKRMIGELGIVTGIAILTNYCIERKALSWFEIPVEKMGWKGHAGQEVVKKILEAYEFAMMDPSRAVTHNKGIMNGIDAVCIATGQDWRAVEGSCHCYASRTGKYLPLSHYETVIKDGVEYFRGSLEVPIAVGVKGGATNKNPLYNKILEMMGNPTSQELSEIIVSAGLAQNLAAVRALAIEGIQKGHMALHKRSKMVNHGEYLTEEQIKQQIAILNDCSPNQMTLKPKL